MIRLVFVVAGALGAACLATAFLRIPARAADDACATAACATPAVAVPASLASTLAVPGARKTPPAPPKDGTHEWIVDLDTRIYFDATCAAAAELDPEDTMRMRFERTLIDLGYRRSGEPGC